MAKRRCRERTGMTSSCQHTRLGHPTADPSIPRCLEIRQIGRLSRKMQQRHTPAPEIRPSAGALRLSEEARRPRSAPQISRQPITPE